MDDINNLLKQVVLKNSKYIVKEEDFDESMDLIDDFGMDSISCIQLTMEIEKTFNIVFDDEDLNIESINTYGKLKKYILSKI